METEEEKYQREAKEAGVDLPDIGKKEPEITPEQKTIDEAKAKADEEAKQKKEEPLQNEQPKIEKKRTIYDDYKEKKEDLKTEKTLREQVEKERDELKLKIEALETAKTPSEKKEAANDLEEFAAETGADAATLAKMREIFLKDIKTSGLSDEDRKIIEDAKKITSQQSKIDEKAVFDSEFSALVPTLKEMYPKVSDTDLEILKKEIDTIAHSKGWHDKDLDYITYKHKDQLSKIITPQKRGMEGKTKKDIIDNGPTDFNPNADYSKMSLKEREIWETNYREMTKNDTLADDGKGGRILL